MEARIRFNYSEVVAEVLNKTELAARSIENAENITSTENMKANTEEYSVSQILRSIRNAIVTILPLMAQYDSIWGERTENGYTSYAEGDATLAYYIDEDGKPVCSENEGIYLLSLPSNFDVTMVDALPSMIHSFVVNMVLYDWFLLTCPAIAAPYKQNADNDLATIKVALSRRVRPSRSRN